MQTRLRSLYQSTDALGTQNLTYFTPILENAHRLQVGAEGAPGGFLGPRAVVAKSCFLTTMCTLSHLIIPFYPGVPEPWIDQCPENNFAISVLPGSTRPKAASSYHKPVGTASEFKKTTDTI